MDTLAALISFLIERWAATKAAFTYQENAASL
jgi:hypothetical protein